MALVTQADGCFRPDERRRMAERGRRSPAVAVSGVQKVLGFEILNEPIERDLGDGAAVETAVRRRVGRSGPWQLLVETTSAAPEARGGFDAEERDVVLRLCELLDVAPGKFEIVAERGRGP